MAQFADSINPVALRDGAIELGGLRVFASGTPHGEIRRSLLKIAGRAQISAPVALIHEKETSITFLRSRSLDCRPRSADFF